MDLSRGRCIDVAASLCNASARAVLHEIKTGLAELTHDGKPVIERVFERDGVCSGPETPKGPDLLSAGHHGFDSKGTVTELAIFGRTNVTGVHTWDDAFFWPPEEPPADLDITQLAGVIEKATDQDAARPSLGVTLHEE